MTPQTRFQFSMILGFLFLVAMGCNRFQSQNGLNDIQGVPCDPNAVIFSRDVMPILSTNCAYSGCHDAATAADDIILDTYGNVMASGEVTPGSANQSELYTVLFDDGDDLMPPPPASPLTSGQIGTIRDWINGGALNQECDIACDNSNPTWSTRVWPLVEVYCKSCHSGISPDGGVRYRNFNDVKASVNDGGFMGTILSSPGYNPMPPAGPMPDCDIEALQIWIENGARED